MTGRGIGQAISLVIFPIDFPGHVTYLTRRAIRMRELEKPPKQRMAVNRASEFPDNYFLCKADKSGLSAAVASGAASA